MEASFLLRMLRLFCKPFLRCQQNDWAYPSSNVRLVCRRCLGHEFLLVFGEWNAKVNALAFRWIFGWPCHADNIGIIIWQVNLGTLELLIIITTVILSDVVNPIQHSADAHDGLTKPQATF